MAGLQTSEQHEKVKRRANHFFFLTMPVIFRLSDKLMPLHVNKDWSILFLKQLVCSKLDCDPHTHFLAYEGVQLNDWDKASNFDFLTASGVCIDVLPHSNTSNYYVLCYDCDNVTPSAFTTVCEKCSSPDFVVSSHIVNFDIRTVSGTCKKCNSSSAKVAISCSRDATHSPTIFLKQVVRNLDRLLCVACLIEAKEIVVKFCENRGHILCLDCFRSYAESYLSDARFMLIPDIGYTLPCPLGCPESFISDTHLFRVLGKAFYSRYKQAAARLFCYTEGCLSCPNCGTFWERIDDQDQKIWVACEEPYGCGVEFCSRCRNIVYGGGNASRCSCRQGEAAVDRSLFGQITRRGILGAWSGVKLNPSDLATHSLIAVTCKSCPCCCSQTNKDGGCNHMECQRANSTQVEISTDTPLARVYFTIDGSRPDPNSWKPRHPQSGPTYLFQGPFTLSPGMKTIKAIAIIPSTSQESNVVAKTLDVLASSGENVNGSEPRLRSVDYDFLDEFKNGKTKTPFRDESRMYASLPHRRPIANGKKSSSVSMSKNEEKHKQHNLHMQENLIPNKDKVKIEKRSNKVGYVVRKPSASKSPDSRCAKTTSQRQDRFSIISLGGDKPRKVQSDFNLCRSNRLQRKVDIFNCPTCLASRPVDADAVFCATCGSSLPRLPSPIIALGRKIANSDVCTSCGSRMVGNANKCPVCESPKGHVKKASIGEPDSMDRRLCSACGSLNPTRVKFCLTCEAVLPLIAANLVNISSLLRNSPDSPPRPTSTRVTSPSRVVATCRICSRRNSLGARFCDWCGIQDPFDVELASQLQSCSVCPKCFWQISRESHFCSQCGFGFTGASETSSLGPDARVPELRNHSLLSLTLHSNRTVSTQTVGLFYPGGSRSKPPGSFNCSIKNLARSRPRMMGFISPGKGLWRMQLEHVVAHVKAYTRNNVDFQKAVGEPRMGKLMYADVDESQPDEVAICFTFKRHSPPVRVCALDEISETSIGVAEDDRMIPSFATATPQSRYQNNNGNTAEIVHPLRAASTPISHCDAFHPMDQRFRSSPPNSNTTDDAFRRGLDKLQVLDGSFTKDPPQGHKDDMNAAEQVQINV
ncbi:Double zinc ribbon and ankyrin repeat-containing protein 1 [Taenia crassiceps]|uniref:Double zinc ribbon and ankyrin repeat-containing protein 1 n=1 Tax=Taenia crassiceps TaxID=6207 RepID=A0ABR4QHM2_9CEST